MSERMTPAQEAAAMWGIAENHAFPYPDRLACALKALTFYGAAYEAAEAESVERRDGDGNLLTRIAGRPDDGPKEANEAPHGDPAGPRTVWAAYYRESGYHPHPLIGLATTRDGAKARAQWFHDHRPGNLRATATIKWDDDPYEGESDTADRISKGNDDDYTVALTEVAFQ